MLHNPSTLYSAGDVKLDSSPYLRIAMAQKARQQAIDEAAYRHYSELPDKLNSAGVRAQDWEDPEGNGGIGQNIEKTKQFFIENSKDILKGGKAAAIYSRMNQNNLRDIGLSKSIGKEEATIGAENLKQGGWRARESDLPVIHKMSLSMFHPDAVKENGSRYGLHDLSVSAAPYSSLRQKQFDNVVFDGVKPEFDKGTEPILDNVSGKMYNTFKYKPEDIYKVGQRAAQMVGSDPTMKYYYEDLLRDNPDAVKTASEALSKVSGVNVVASTPQQLAAGLAIHKANTPTQQEETNQELVQKRKKQLLDQRQAFQKSESAKRRAQSEKNANIIKGNYGVTDPYETIQKNALELPTKSFDATSPFGQVKGKEKFAPFTGMSENEIQDAFGAKDDYGRRKIPTITKEINGVEVEGVAVDEDGNLLDADGKPVDREQGISNKVKRLGSIKKQESKGQFKVKPVGTKSEPKVKDPLGIF